MFGFFRSAKIGTRIAVALVLPVAGLLRLATIEAA